MVSARKHKHVHGLHVTLDGFIVLFHVACSVLTLFFFFLFPTCPVAGHPKPQVEWLHDGIPVEQSARVTVEYEKDGLWALVLTDLVPADSGVYECRATNDRGRALSTAKLTVEL